MAREDTVLMEEVEIIFRNFSGKETQYNREGDRNFGVKLPPEIAQRMLDDGWNVKYLKPREEDEGEEETEAPWLPVAVGFGGKGSPPSIYMITERGRTLLDEHTVDLLDGVEVVNTDLIVRPYHWEVNGNQGVKAYLKTMYITIHEDPLASKYAAMDAQSAADGPPS